jgi:two-component system sensor histidine kinase YesM
MVAWLRKLRIRDQLLIVILSTTAVIFAIVIVMSIKIAGTVSRKANAYIRDIISQTKRSVSEDVDNIGRLALSIAYNPTVQEYLIAGGDMERYQLFQKVDKILMNMKEMRSGIKEIIVLGDNGNYAGYLGGIDSQKEAIGALHNATVPYCPGVFEVSTTSGFASCLVIGVSVYDLEVSGFTKKRLGLTAVLVDPNSIGAGIAELSTAHSARFYLLDRNGRTFASNVSTGSDVFARIVEDYGKRVPGQYTVQSRQERLTVDVIDLDGIGGKMVSIVDERELLADVATIRLWGMAIFLLALAVLAVPFLLVTNNIVQPLRTLMDFMNRVRSGDPTSLQGRVSLEGNAEVGVMAGVFNAMLDEIDTLTRRLLTSNSMLYESELLQKRSELAFLRSQINPHFLYNTLESIRSISSLKGVTEVKEMAQSLAQVLRYSIRGIETVTLDEELAIVKSYLRIQLIRFKGRFAVEYDFSKAMLESRVIKMILQPIVENAIYHGLEPKRGKGRLTVAGALIDHDTLDILVKDDGVGMQDRLLEGIRASLCRDVGEQHPEGKQGYGVGVINVHNLLRLTYGNEYGIRIDSSPNVGTEVWIRIPFRNGSNV